MERASGASADQKENSMRNRFNTIKRVRYTEKPAPRHQFTVYLSDEEAMRLAELRSMLHGIPVTDAFRLAVNHTHKEFARQSRRAMTRRKEAA